jgi:hypothetical protein
MCSTASGPTIPITMYAPVARLVDLQHDTLSEPAEPWEPLATKRDLDACSTLGRVAYAEIPRDLGDTELPTSAVAELEASVGALQPGRVILLPRTPRVTGRREWAMTPACVLGIGEDAVALWADRAGDRIVARIPYGEIAGVADLTVLLFGRLEIVGPATSIVMRYNMVGRPEIREALRAIRERFEPAPPLPGAPSGPSPGELPHKWMALLRSGDLRNVDGTDRITAAGTLVASKPLPRIGVAVASPREVMVATEPATPGVGGYGVDLVTMPTSSIRGLGPAGHGRLEARLASAETEVVLRLPAHPSLVHAVAATITPAVAAGRGY